MFTIRQEQMDILSKAEENKFEFQLLDMLQNHYIKAQSNPFIVSDSNNNQKALDWLRVRLDQAASYGMEYEGDIAIFVILTIEEPLLCMDETDIENEDSEAPMSFEVEEKNDLLSWIKPLLTLEDTSGDIKISLIEHELYEQTENNDVHVGKLITIIKSVREIFG